jgi:mycothiol synthase
MRLRAPRDDEAEAVFEVILARDLADLGFADFTLEDLRDEWGRAGFELQADAVVCEDEGGSIVGYAVIRRTHALAVVAPSHEGKGIGALLLGWTQARERELGRERHRQGIASTDARAARLLLEAGYRREHSYTRLARELQAPAGAAETPRPPTGPDGVALRELAPELDAAAVYELDKRSFADAPDYEPMSFAAFNAEHIDVHDQATELSAVAEEDGRLVGFLLARRWQAERVGFVDVLAVRPDRQGAGIGTALLLGAFTRFAEAGLREAQLGVASTNPDATRLYERLGMSPRFRIDTYARAVTGE